MGDLQTDLKRWRMLVEMKRFTLPVHGGVEVWQDPNAAMIQRLIRDYDELRGVADGDTYWVWAGRAADHYHVEPHLGLEDATGLVITRDGYVPDWGHWSKQIPYRAHGMRLWFEGSEDDLPSGLARIFQTVQEASVTVGAALREAGETAYLYHGTAEARLPSIRSQGLLPTSKSRFRSHEIIKNSGGKNHFSDSFDGATLYARNASFNRPMILRVPRQMIPDLHPDPFDPHGMSSDQPIAPDLIARWVGKHYGDESSGKWLPLVRTNKAEQ